MAIAEVSAFIQTHWPLLGFIAGFSYILHSYISGYLFLANRDFKGPFLAGFTNLWQLWDTNVDLTRVSMLDVHKKYGSVVRIGPDMLSFSDPEAARDIYYGIGREWPKSEKYQVMGTFSRGAVDEILFSSTNKKWHDDMRRCVNPAFSMGSILKMEHLVDQMLEVFVQQLQHRYADKGKAVDISEWLCYFTIDTMSVLTYGDSWKCLESGTDVDGILNGFEMDLRYAQKFCAMPVLDKLLRKNPIIGYLDWMGLLSSTPPTVANVAMRYQTARENANEETKVKGDGKSYLVDDFIRAKRENPGVFTETDVLKLGVNSLFAGADTTGITLSALFYYLLKDQECYQKLVYEVDAKLGKSPCTYTQTTKMPYLDACIKETFRMHPILRITPTRVVTTPGGARIAGRFVPEGAVVGVNAWVAHHNPVFGKDVGKFVPERWLQDEAKAKVMNQSLLHFGAGNFICIGKNIAYIEMYKLVPRLLQAFDMELENKDREWRLLTGIMAKPADVFVKLTPRA